MTSAMLALAAAVGRELVLGDLQTLMLEAAGGKVLMLAIQAEGRAPLLLMAACDQRSVIGQVLWQSRNVARRSWPNSADREPGRRGTRLGPTSTRGATWLD